jgi:hypothetical protein
VKIVDNEVLEKARFLYDVGTEAYKTVSEFNRQTDQKIVGTVTAVSTLTPILLGIFYYLFARPETSPKMLRPLFSYPFIIGVILFTTVVFLGFLLYRAREFRMLRINSVIEEAEQSGLVDITKIAVVNIADVSNHNIGVVLKKSNEFNVLLLILFIGLVFFVIAFVDLVFLL